MTVEVDLPHRTRKYTNFKVTNIVFCKGLEKVSLAKTFKMDAVEVKQLTICGLASMGHGFINTIYNFLLADALAVRYLSYYLFTCEQ